jgi:hypothetical protein
MQLERYVLKGSECIPFLDEEDPHEDNGLVWRAARDKLGVDVLPVSVVAPFFAALMREQDPLVLSRHVRVPYVGFQSAPLAGLDGLTVNRNRLNRWIDFLASTESVHVYASPVLRNAPHTVVFSLSPPDEQLYSFVDRLPYVLRP